LATAVSTAKPTHPNQPPRGAAGTIFSRGAPPLRPLGAAVILWVLFPTAARADAGTPLLWATAFHLIVGNALVGLFEAYLLKRFFALPQQRCTSWMILANYVSAWIGCLLLPGWYAKDSVTINNGYSLFWILALISYCLTLVIEWPFVALCFRGTPGWLKRSLKGSLLVQSASYALLFGGFWLLSGTSLYTRFQVVPPSELPLSPALSIYYISATNGNVYCAQADQVNDALVYELRSTNKFEFLYVREPDLETNLFDLAVKSRYSAPNEKVLLPGKVKASDFEENRLFHTEDYYSWGSAMKIGAATNSPWHYGWTDWADIGFWGVNKETSFRLAFGTLFGGWPPRRVIQLPQDTLLVQYGDNQICLVDIERRKVALIRRGYGPWVLPR
jgi:hypothetical protein